MSSAQRRQRNEELREARILQKQRQLQLQVAETERLHPPDPFRALAPSHQHTPSPINGPTGRRIIIGRTGGTLATADGPFAILDVAYSALGSQIRYLRDEGITGVLSGPKARLLDEHTRTLVACIRLEQGATPDTEDPHAGMSDEELKEIVKAVAERIE